MKFAFVTTNLRGGGAENALLKLAGALTTAGHEVHLILLENIVEHAAAGGFRMHALTSSGRAASKGFFGKRLAALRLRRLVRRLGQGAPFDAIVSTLPYADEVAALARLPRLWHRIANTLSAEVAALRATHPAKARRRLARYRRLYGGGNLIAVSQGVADDLREELALGDTNIVVARNPFDPAAIRALAAAGDADIPGQPYILHVGRFARQKRHDLLFRAFKAAGLPHKLVLLTKRDGALDAMIERFGVKDDVIVAGFRPNPYPWIRGAALLVLCSDHEGMPNVLVETLICDTRVVSTDCPSGPREIMTGELARFLVPCDDAQALAHAMREALADPPPGAETPIAPFLAPAVVSQLEQLPRLWRAVA